MRCATLGFVVKRLRRSPPGPPDGPYHIDSFFDVFTELSVDGGATWIPNSQPSAFGEDGSTRLVLGIPEPASLMLLIIALFGIAGLYAHRR